VKKELVPNIRTSGIVNLFVGTEAIAVLKRRRDIAEP
jgi:hypothetical protein